MILSLQLILFPATASAGTSGAAYAKGISSLAIGVTGTMAVTSCVGSLISPYVFSAGAIVMIAGDMVLAKKYTDYQKKKNSELKLKEDEMKDGNGDFQKEIIDQRLEMEKAELENIKKRETLHYVLGTVMTAAMGVAIYELIANKAAQAVSFGAAKPFIGYCTCSKDAAMASSISKTITFTWGQAVNMLVGVASSSGGGTSAFGSWFSYIQMALPLMSSTISGMMDSMISSDITRSIFFGANAAILYWVADDLSAKKKIAKDNIAKLEELKKKVKGTESEGVAAGPGNYADGDNQNLNGVMNIKELPQVAEVKSCFSMDKGIAAFGSSSCKTAVKLSPINFKGGLNIPTLQSVSNSAVTAANSLTAGNWEGAEVAFGEINSKAAQIRDINEQLQKKYNDQMKAEGKPTIDFKGEIAKQVAAIDSEVAKAMGIPASSLADAPQATISKDDAPKEEVASSPSAPVIAPVAEIPSMNLSGIGGGMEQADVSGEAPAKSLDDSLGEYEVAENDIAKDPGVSIFKQVSNRYILNYRQFFSAAKKSLSPSEGAAEKTAPAASP